MNFFLGVDIDHVMEEAKDPVVTSLYVGILPSASMLAMSLLIIFNLLPNFSGLNSADIEAYTQSFCGGMILAAVASELFPILETSSFFGVSMGIFIGLSVIYILAVQDELFEAGGRDEEEEQNEKDGKRHQVQNFGKSSNEERKNLMTENGADYYTLENAELSGNLGLSIEEHNMHKDDDDNSDGRSSPLTSAHSDIESGVDVKVDGMGSHADHWAVVVTH